MNPDTPSGVTRYKLDRNCGPCADGPWVAYSDHEPVERERAALKERVKRLEEAYRQAREVLEDADALSRYRELLREAAAKFTEIAWLVNSCNGLDASRDCANLAARIRKEIGE